MKIPKIRREAYLDFLHTWQDRDVVKVLLGVRRFLENVIYLELLRRGYTVYVGRVDKYEIDFVAVNTVQNLAYYQVALETLNEETLARELRPLQRISDSYPKYLLTLDRIGSEANYHGIVKMNALDWLLSKEKL